MLRSDSESKIVPHESGEGFSVRLQRKPNNKREKKVLREAHPYEDDGFEQVTLHNYHDYSYSGPIYLGS